MLLIMRMLSSNSCRAFAILACVMISSFGVVFTAAAATAADAFLDDATFLDDGLRAVFAVEVTDGSVLWLWSR